jgi:shikimate kinase
VTAAGADADRHIVVIGMMGVGKSTVGRLVAAGLGRPFWDNDEALQKATGRTAAEVQEGEGQAALHRRENELLRDALQSDVPSVLAAAASVVLEPDTVRGAIVIWLRASIGTEEQHLASSGQHHRPLPALRDQFLRRLAAEREPLYEQLADVTVDVGSDPKATAEQILEALRRSVPSST